MEGEAGMNVDPRAVRDLLADARLASARADAAEARGWVVVSRDDEYGHLHITGPYETPEAALIAAQRDHEAVNSSLPDGEPGWTHTVHPLFAATTS